MDAETKTQVIANGLGVSIRGIRYVKENAGRVTGRENVMMTKMASGSLLDANDGVETPIEVGDIEVNASVHVEYIID
ncbi:MAG: SIMPL domain-containing protein [Anaerovibrio sp.]|nr:SIMPL domain-containing protein [Anaerovibrio sp.]